jgi:hypothetical protein
MAEEEGKVGVPARLIITITANLNIQEMPPEMLKKLGTIDDLKAWAANFKLDMEGDPEFGKYCKVNISTEEVL